MSDVLPVRVEVWPIAADAKGLWLLSGDDAWRSTPVVADSEPHASVVDLLTMHRLPRPAVLHSTSWRTDDDAVVLTYVAVIPAAGAVRVEFSQATPISLRAVHAVGKPVPADPAEPPAPRYVDVLLHAIRHLRFLADTDAAAREAMGARWRDHLAPLEPVLAGMYQEPV